MARYSKAFRAREEPSIARVYPDINTQRCARQLRGARRQLHGICTQPLHAKGQQPAWQRHGFACIDCDGYSHPASPPEYWDCDVRSSAWALLQLPAQH